MVAGEALIALIRHFVFLSFPPQRARRGQITPCNLMLGLDLPTRSKEPVEPAVMAAKAGNINLLSVTGLECSRPGLDLLIPYFENSRCPSAYCPP